MCFQKLRGEFRKRGGGLVNMITEGGDVFCERSHIFKYDSKLQTGIVVCVYQCKVTMIRNRYPSKSGKYIGFRSLKKEVCEKLSIFKSPRSRSVLVLSISCNNIFNYLPLILPSCNCSTGLQ